MIYPENTHIRYINLPKIPNELLKRINFNSTEYNTKSSNTPGYKWTDDFNQEVNAWCQENICENMYWAFQFIDPPMMPTHKDRKTLTKFCYILDPGGDNVETRFYDEHDPAKVIESVVIQPHRWHILKVDCYHSVHGIEPNRVRFSITGRIFP
jgi:hypothetical protein